MGWRRRSELLMRGVDDKVRKGALSFWCEGDCWKV
jgi:hypothetical protein